MTSHLMFLQYNIHTTEGKVMAPVYADHQILEFTVKAIKESWQIIYTYVTHNPSNSPFHHFYPPFANALASFLVNAFLNLSSCSTALLAPRYDYKRLRSSVE